MDPSHFSRTYVGPDFTVEQVWVPLDKPAVLIRYTVRSVHFVQVIVRFHPSLNLMWPAAVGGQEAPGATAHDELLNTTLPLEQSDELTVALDDKSPQVLFARLTTGAEEGSELDLASAQALLTLEQWKQDSRKHYEDVLASVRPRPLRIAKRRAAQPLARKPGGIRLASR